MTSSSAPDKVAQSFLKQYYSMLSTQPDDLYRFYNDQSSFTHSYGQHVEPAARGPAEIREKVAALRLAGTRVDLSNGSVDAQLSVDNAVFVTVTGTFTHLDEVPRPFVQSFFLATQPGSNNARSYFVMNSVFRQLSIEASGAREQGAVAEKAVQHQQVEADKGAGSVPQAAEHQKVAVEEAAPAVAEPVASTPEEPAAEEVEPVAPAAAAEEAPAAAEEEPAAPVREQPKSFLDALKKSLPANGAAPATQAPVARAPRQTRPAAATREEKGESKEQRPATHSIYISNLPEGAAVDELRELFGKFGNIVSVEIPQGRGFAFVDYDAAEGVQAALNSGEQFSLRDKQLRVEEKTSSAKGGRKGAGAKPRGASPKNGERREKGKDGPRRDVKRSPAQRDGARPQGRAPAARKN